MKNAAIGGLSLENPTEERGPESPSQGSLCACVQFGVALRTVEGFVR